MPLTVSVLTFRAHLDSVGRERSTTAIPVNPETDNVVVKIKLEILCVLNRIPRKRVHPVDGVAALLPKIESEIASSKVPVVTWGYRDIVIFAIEVKCIADLSRCNGRIV